MGIDSPSSGDVLTKESIKGMHDTVRDRVNSSGSGDWGRATFGFAQVNSSQASIIHHSDTVNITTVKKVSSNGESTADGNILSADWTELTDYNLDGGYAIDTDNGNDLLIWFNCRIHRYTDSSDTDKKVGNQVAAFALGWQLDGGSVSILSETVRVVDFMKNGDAFANPSDPTHDIPVSIWTHQVIPESYTTLTSIRVYATKLLGGGGYSAATDDRVHIAAGTTGMLMFRR